MLRRRLGDNYGLVMVKATFVQSLLVQPLPIMAILQLRNPLIHCHERGDLGAACRFAGHCDKCCGSGLVIEEHCEYSCYGCPGTRRLKSAKAKVVISCCLAITLSFVAR